MCRYTYSVHQTCVINFESKIQSAEFDILVFARRNCNIFDVFTGVNHQEWRPVGSRIFSIWNEPFVGFSFVSSPTKCVWVWRQKSMCVTVVTTDWILDHPYVFFSIDVLVDADTRDTRPYSLLRGSIRTTASIHTREIENRAACAQNEQKYDWPGTDMTCTWTTNSTGDIKHGHRHTCTHYHFCVEIYGFGNDGVINLPKKERKKAMDFVVCAELQRLIFFVNHFEMGLGDYGYKCTRLLNEHWMWTCHHVQTHRHQRSHSDFTSTKFNAFLSFPQCRNRTSTTRNWKLIGKLRVFTTSFECIEKWHLVHGRCVRVGDDIVHKVRAN